MTLKPNLIIIKFILTGFMGLIIDFSITWYLKELIETNIYFANCCGFSSAVFSNYYISRNWAFKSKSQKIKQEFLRFATVSMVGLALNSLIVYISHTILDYQFYLSKIAAIFLVFFWNLVANSYFTFGKSFSQSSVSA